MEKRTEEWLRQSDYDMDTADYMFQGGRYVFAVFMCHRAVGIMPPEKPGRFIIRLSEASIPTREPEDLARAQQVYAEGVVRDILAGGKEAIAWIRAQLST